MREGDARFVGVAHRAEHLEVLARPVADARAPADDHVGLAPAGGVPNVEPHELAAEVAEEEARPAEVGAPADRQVVLEDGDALAHPIAREVGHGVERRRRLGEPLRREKLLDHRQLGLAGDPGHRRRVLQVHGAGRDLVVPVDVAGDPVDPDARRLRFGERAPRHDGLERVAACLRGLDDLRAGDGASPSIADAPLALAGLAGVDRELVGRVRARRHRYGEHQGHVIASGRERGDHTSPRRRRASRRRTAGRSSSTTCSRP